MTRLDRISPENVSVFKTIRLRALEDSPSALGSTYARESQLSDEEWRQRSLRWTSDGSTGYVAFDRASPCGLAACYTEEHSLQSGHVIPMWVDPGSRRSGLGRALIEALTAVLG